ncbi:MAG: hydantoin utilization protein A [Sandaracinaceae bacterium]
MTGAGLAVLTGLVAGGGHVVAGPDHLAAVLPLAAGSRSRAMAVGALWGLGHGAGVLAAALLARTLLRTLDVEAVSAWAEVAVGVLLVGLGVWALRRSRLLTVHAHRHDHDGEHGHGGERHAHVHVHVADPTVGEPEHRTRGDHQRHRHSAFGFGMLHGVAGAGHLFGVLPSLALGPAMAAAYLAAYLVGAVVAMAAFAAGVGALTATPARLPRMLAGAGVLSVVVGVVWVGGSLAG